MKRMIAFFIAIGLLIGVKFACQSNSLNYDFEKLIIVSSSECLYDTDFVRNGNKYYYSFDKNQGEKALENIKSEEVEGLVYYFDLNYNLKNLKNKLDYCYKGGSASGIEIYYGYDKQYKDYRIVNRKKVNVQIVKNSTNIIVGYPLILTSY